MELPNPVHLLSAPEAHIAHFRRISPNVNECAEKTEPPIFSGTYLIAR
jgi:hypothetical protein